MFTFSELLNQWFADHSSDAKKENYLQFKENIEKVLTKNKFKTHYLHQNISITN